MTLEPLAEKHRGGLWEAAQADEIWEWLATLNKSREIFDQWFDLTLASNAAGEGNPAETGAFAVRRRADGALVGSSRYLGVRRADRCGRGRLDLVQPFGVADRGQRRDENADVYARLRDARLRPGRAEDRRPQRALARGDGRPTRPVRGDHAQAPDHPRRRPTRQRLLQRHRRRVADRPRRPRARLLLARSSSSGWTTRSAAARISSPAWRVAATASSVAWVMPSLGLPPTMSRKASLKRSVRRPGWKRSSAFACFFGWLSP